MTQTSLRLTSGPPAWDALRYLWAFCDGGHLQRLGAVEVKVHYQAFRMADRGGECDVPAAWLADRLGFSERAVRDAIKGLRRRGYFRDAGPGSVDPRVRRIRLVLPHEPSACHPAIAADSPGPNGSAAGADTGTPAHRYLNAGAPIPEPPFRERMGERNGKEISRSAQRPSTPDPGLFERPVFDRAAAAALVVWAGFAPKLAHGMVTQYRPTRRQVLCILANAAAWRRAVRLGEAPPLRDTRGFVRAALRSGDWTLDDRVRAFERRRLARLQAAERPEDRQQLYAEARRRWPELAAYPMGADVVQQAMRRLRREGRS